MSEYENNMDQILVEVKEEVGEERSNNSIQEDWNGNKPYGTGEESAIKEWTDFEKFCTKVGKEGRRTLYSCSLCGTINKTKGRAMEHVESAHFNATFFYPCKICGSVSKTKGAFKQHTLNKHKSAEAKIEVPV